MKKGVRHTGDDVRGWQRAGSRQEVRGNETARRPARHKALAAPGSGFALATFWAGIPRFCAYRPTSPRTAHHVGFSAALRSGVVVWVRCSPPDATDPRAGAQAEGVARIPGVPRGRLPDGFGRPGRGSSPCVERWADSGQPRNRGPRHTPDIGRATGLGSREEANTLDGGFAPRASPSAVHTVAPHHPWRELPAPEGRWHHLGDERPLAVRISYCGRCPGLCCR